IGGADPLDWEYLKALKTLTKRVGPQWVSDHLCWTGVGGANLHDLMPLPYTDHALAHVSDRVRQVQDFLERRILLENVSSYVTYKQSDVTEWDFLSAIAERSDCLILLDINNLYVSSQNHDFDPIAYLDALPGERIYQMHLAGHTRNGRLMIDTHDQPVIDPVWALYAEAVRRFGRVSTMIERDDNIPPLSELLSELDRARYHHDIQIARGPVASLPKHDAEARSNDHHPPSVPLRRLQHEFQSHLLRSNSKDRFAEQVLDGEHASAHQRLTVYSEAYRLRLLEVLETDFPGLRALLGDEEFDDLGRAYIDAHPSHDPSVRWFGRHMSDYLRAADRYAKQAILVEMAAFEWTQGEVFDAEEARTVVAGDVMAIAPERWSRMRLWMHPSVRSVNLTWNVPALWAAINAEEDPPKPQQSDHPTAWVLWRRNLDVHWRSLSVDEAFAIDRAFQNASFGALCEDLLEWLDPQAAPMRAAALLKQWVSDGLVARIDLGAVDESRLVGGPIDAGSSTDLAPAATL
ncbi:MAG: DUF692 family multinuclear iron-containing protein, partial [Polyangiales bacterium]